MGVVSACTVMFKKVGINRICGDGVGYVDYPVNWIYIAKIIIAMKSMIEKVSPLKEWVQ